jgi:hypothetical protein
MTAQRVARLAFAAALVASACWVIATALLLTSSAP